jgi:murein DD-endopeptidase MepM/ murein hydrolase activator NlpD
LHSAAVVAREALARLGVNHRIAALAVALLSPLRSIVAPFFGSATELLGGDPGRLHPLAQSRKLVGVGADGIGHAAHIDPARIVGAVRSHMVHPDRPERLVPIGVCALLVVAAALSSLPPVGTVNGGAAPTHGPRVVIAGLDNTGSNVSDVTGPAAPSLASAGLPYYAGDVTIPNTLAGPEVGSDGGGVLSTYVVAFGDTVGAIAARFDISLTTLYWANSQGLPDPQAIHVGQRLIIPPVDGLVVVVAAADTIDSLAAKYKVAPQDLMDANNLAGPNIVTGETLFVPGANGGPIPTPTPAPTPAPTAKPKPASVRVSGGGGGGSTSCSTCSAGTYAGGDFLWPVAGGHSYISQRFSSYHHAIDIASPYGSPVVAAASGVVVFAGWRSYTGGGNVIWISDGSGLYTTYNHLSAWSVQAGQTVSAGQRIGSVGTSGMATGPHLHFEVWVRYPWAAGNDSAAGNPCIYLAAC